MESTQLKHPSWTAPSSFGSCPETSELRKKPFFRVSPFVKSFGGIYVLLTKKTSPNVTVLWLDTSKKGLEAWLHPLTTHVQAYVAGTKIVTATHAIQRFLWVCTHRPKTWKSQKKKSCLKSSRWSQNRFSSEIPVISHPGFFSGDSHVLEKPNDQKTTFTRDPTIPQSLHQAKVSGSVFFRPAFHVRKTVHLNPTRHQQTQHLQEIEAFKVVFFFLAFFVASIFFDKSIDTPYQTTPLSFTDRSSFRCVFFFWTTHLLQWVGIVCGRPETYLPVLCLPFSHGNQKKKRPPWWLQSVEKNSGFDKPLDTFLWNCMN